MGMIRKSMSMMTVGLVDFRSDKERTAAYTRGARTAAKKGAKQAKAQTEVLRQQAAMHASSFQQQAAAPVAQPVRQGPPPGFYADQNDPTLERWFDGADWTSVTQPRR